MKIGILTLPLHGNYGGNLQAYALMAALRSMGHEPFLIARRKPPMARSAIPLEIAKRLVKRLFLRRPVSIGEGILHHRLRDTRNKWAKEFILSHIQPQTLEFGSERELSTHLPKYGFDAIIVGSDQIWRPKYAPNIEESFLSFLGDDTSIRRVSYAPSFGTDDWEYTPEQQEKCAYLAKKFSAVSVRETSAIGLCKLRLGVEATHVVDPTMLLNRADYLSLTQDISPPTSSQPQLLVYVLDESQQKQDAIDVIAASLCLETVRANRLGSDGATLPVESWLAAFRDCSFVITDSFHACVFAIIFEKPFIAYGNANRGLARFDSLLGMLNLRHRLVSSPDEVTSELVSDSINWAEVRTQVTLRQMAGYAFLKDALTP